MATCNRKIVSDVSDDSLTKNVIPSNKLAFLEDLRNVSIACRDRVNEHKKELLAMKKMQQRVLKDVSKQFKVWETKLQEQLSTLDKQYDQFQRWKGQLNSILAKKNENGNRKRGNTLSIEEIEHESSIEGTNSTLTSSSAKSSSPIMADDVNKSLKDRIAPINFKRRKKSKSKSTEVILGNNFVKYSGRWDFARSGQFSSISNDGCLLSTTDYGWNVVIGQEPTDSYSVKLVLPTTKRKNSVAIGLTSDSTFWKLGIQHAQEYFLFREHGWFLNVQNGALCSRAGHDNTPYTKKFKTGDILTVAFNRTTNTMLFLKNGKDLGLAYSNVYDGEMFPVVVSYDRGVKISLL